MDIHPHDSSGSDGRLGLSIWSQARAPIPSTIGNKRMHLKFRKSFVSLWWNFYW